VQRNNWFRIKLSGSCLQAHVVHHAANVPERSASALLDGGKARGAARGYSPQPRSDFRNAELLPV